MDTEQVVIDDDNNSRETVIVLDEDSVTNSQNKPIGIEIDTGNLHEEITQRSSNDVMKIDEICNKKCNGKSNVSFSNVLRDTIEIVDGDCVTNSGDTVNLDEILLSGSNANISEESFAKLLRNNRLMSKLIRKCLNMNDSNGMTRVIYKTVIPIYNDTDTSFKESAHLRRVIKTTLKQLELDPCHRFSHIKSLCNLLLSNKYKKKVPLITLSTDLKKRSDRCPENNTSQITDENNFTKRKRKKAQTDVIDLVNTDKEIINIDSNEEDCNIINLDDQIDEENNKITNNVGSGITHVHLHKQMPNTSKHDVESNLLMQHKHEDFRDEAAVLRKVQMIEAEIASYKSNIETLEKLEVTDFTHRSPYLQCDRLKAKVVSLYKEICTLTGGQSVKRREVRLQVTEGHPPGPVKRLEEFLNWNIDSTGNPPFPDFHDVLHCVERANNEDCLGWTRGEIMKEATSLFTQCGHALRKRRQKREYRDLMSLVKEELPDDDPADEDPQLSAKLELNKRFAQEKEHHILERFTQMEYRPTVSSPLSPRLGNMDILQDTYDTSDSESENDNVGCENQNGVSNCEVTRNTVDTDNANQENVPSNTNVAEVTNDGSELPVQIKQEPADIQSMLEGLGTDYTVTVFDIEDPFLVIEISSDSSYSDDNS